MKMPAFIFIALLATACNSSSDNKQDSVDSTRNKNDSVVSVNDNENDFATEAASGGLLEVKLGQLAQQNAQSQRVKDFGMMMIRDHTKGNAELKALAAQKSISLPAQLADKHQKHYDELAKKTGKDFDKDYIDFMQSDHKEDIDDYTKAAKNVKDPEIKAYAASHIPTLQMHLDSVNAIKDALK
jgi:putative membrane protein